MATAEKFRLQCLALKDEPIVISSRDTYVELRNLNCVDTECDCDIHLERS